MKNEIATNDICDNTETTSYWNKTTFGLRLAILRQDRGYSARKMSLELGQNKNYINSIETGHNFPTMDGFFNICDYLHIEPQYFFEISSKHSIFSPFLQETLSTLSEDEMESLCIFVSCMTKHHML